MPELLTSLRLPARPGVARLAALALGCYIAAGGAWAQGNPQICGSLANGNNGPFDYRVDRDKLKIVEEYHFNPKVEALIAGQSGAIAADLDYVLRAFPNHHRALISMSRLALRHKSPVAPHAPISAECYFERALRFRPDDTVARMLYASFLRETKRNEPAVEQLEQAIQIGRDNAFTQYNAGLVFADMGLFDRALQQAHKAQAMGFTRPELKDKLRAAGRWSESATSAAAAANAVAAEPPASAASAAGS